MIMLAIQLPISIILAVATDQFCHLSGVGIRACRQAVDYPLPVRGRPVLSELPLGLDPRDLHIVTRVNGNVRQDSSTSDLIFDVATLIAFCSKHMTLEAGDVISTGTPAGVGNLDPGDLVEIEIEGIGTLSNPVIVRP